MEANLQKTQGISFFDSKILISWSKWTLSFLETPGNFDQKSFPFLLDTFSLYFSKSLIPQTNFHYPWR